MTKQKDKGANFERRLVHMAKEKGLDARKQPLSGQLPEYPSDVAIEGILLEAKAGYTKYNQAGDRFFSLDMNWIDKNEGHARRVGFKYGVLGFRPDGSNRVWALVPMENFLDLVKESKHGA